MKNKILELKINKNYKDNELKKFLKPQWSWKTLISIVLFFSILIFIIKDLEIDFIKLISDSSKYFGDILSRMLPPDFSNLSELIFAMFETVEIAVLGTFIAIVLSIPLGLFSARNLAPNYFIYLMCKTIVIFFRAIPEFIIAMILVIAIGFGAMPGVLALGLHTMGFLAKFYAEDIEHINKGPIDALKSSGANKSQIISFGVIPQILPSFVANNLYILDRNVRMATMLGIVGAGGKGQGSLKAATRPNSRHKTGVLEVLAGDDDTSQISDVFEHSRGSASASTSADGSLVVEELLVDGDAQMEEDVKEE